MTEKSGTKEFKSGFNECWKMATLLSDNDLKSPFVFDIWKYHKSKELIAEQRFLIKNMTKEDVFTKSKNENKNLGLSTSERQWIQIEKVKNNDEKPYVDLNGLQFEIMEWKFPLHFIDFETSAVAIPINCSRRPYEQIAFQFSHHIVKCLEKDLGSIFRYATHENSVLCQIFCQLEQSNEPDKTELMQWIQTITTSLENSLTKWSGERNMIDLCNLVKKYYYHPAMKGSNSIKKVLPAVLQDSKYLQDKYSKPIYGSHKGIKSLNFENWLWIEEDSFGKIKDPYKKLPPIFDDFKNEAIECLFKDESIAEGGAAMTAFARMQFTQMTDVERQKLSTALLKYCELDTFSMVMIYEYWQNLITKNLN